MWRALFIVMLVSVTYLASGKSEAAPLELKAYCCKPVCGGCFAP